MDTSEIKKCSPTLVGALSAPSRTSPRKLCKKLSKRKLNDRKELLIFIREALKKTPNIWTLFNNFLLTI